MLLLLVLLPIAGCADLRVKEGIFTNLDEARAAGAVASGWIPDGLPASAADLREGHMPDGRHWGVFIFPLRDAAVVRGLLGPEIVTGTLSCEAPGRLEWWPRLLHSPIDVGSVRSTGFRLYGDRASQLTFAINWGQGRAYYWRG